MNFKNKLYKGGFFCASLAMAFALSGCGDAPTAEKENAESNYLFVWAGDADGQEPDFLAVIDGRSDAPTYGDIVATLPVDMKEGMPHHTEYEFPDGDFLFANGWLAGKSFVFDLTDPLTPKVAATFEDRDGYSYPHSYARLKNGNVLATFQGRDGVYGAPGGLVELDPLGNVVRSAFALAPGSPEEEAWPYSLGITPDGGRAVVAMAEMGMPPWKEFTRTNKIQIWDTETLSLIAEIALPEEEGGWRHLDPAEPRFLADGTAYVSTFTCGLYLIEGVDGDEPKAKFVYGFPGGDTIETACSVPVVAGDYWVQPVFENNGLIVLDLSNRDAPVEVDRLTLDDEQFKYPHWIAADRKSNRLVLTGADQSWVLVLKIDPVTGKLSVDEAFGGGEGITFDRQEWPHGATGAAIVHGSLFGG